MADAPTAAAAPDNDAWRQAIERFCEMNQRAVRAVEDLVTALRTGELRVESE